MRKAILLLLLATFCGTAYAQSNDSLVVLWLSDPGVRPGQIFADGFESGDVSRFEANGDNRTDLILRREDSQGMLQGLLVISGATLDTLWRVQDVQGELGITSNMDLWGFGDVDADGQPEAIFYDDNQVSGFHLYRNNLSWKVEEGESFRFLGATDLTGDGFQEIIIYVEASKIVKIYTGIMFETQGHR